MHSIRTLLLAAVPVVALGACTTLSDADRATLNAASQNAQQAKETSQQALDAARAAAQSASQVAADARAANEKADRMYQRSLRKTSR